MFHQWRCSFPGITLRLHSIFNSLNVHKVEISKHNIYSKEHKLLHPSDTVVTPLYIFKSKEHFQESKGLFILPSEWGVNRIGPAQFIGPPWKR